MSVSLITQLFMVVGLIPPLRYIAILERAERSNTSVLPYIVVSSMFLGVVFSILLEGQILAGLSLGTGTVISIFHPVVAVSFLVNNLILRPWELIPSSPYLLYLPKFLAVVAFVSFGISLTRNSKPILRWNWMMALFFSFSIWLYISSLFSFYQADSMDYLMQAFLPVIITVFLVSSTCEHWEDVALLRKSFAIAIIGVLCVALFVSGGPGGVSSLNRLHGPGMWGNANDLASLIVFILPFVLLKNRSERGNSLGSIWTFCYRLVFVLLLAVALWGTQSRGAMTALVVAIGVYYLCCRDINLRGLILLVIGVSLTFAVMASLSRDDDELVTSRSARWNYVVAGVRMALDYPLFGVGVSNYPRYYERYTPSFEEWGERTAHSSWVLILAECGVVGFSIFLTLFFLAFKMAWKLRREFPELLVILVSYGIAMSFLSHAYSLLPFFLIALILVTSRSAHKYNQKMLSVFSVMLLLMTGSCLAESHTVLEGVSSGDKPREQYIPRLENELNLYGSRSEVLNFVIHIDPESPCKKWNVEVSERKVNSSPFLVRLFYLPDIEISNSSYTNAPRGRYLDPAVPVEGSWLCSKNTFQGWIWGELEIPATKPAGDYMIKLRFGEGSLPINVRVWNMQIGDRFAFPAYSELTTWFNLLGHFGKWQEGEGVLARKYIKAMLEHRIIPLKTSVSMPRVVDDSEAGMDLTNTPTPSTSFREVTLYMRPSWAYYDFPTTAYSEFSYIAAVKYYSAIEKSLSEIGRKSRAMIYLWDEPKKEQVPKLLKLAKLVKEHAPSVKIMVTDVSRPELDDVIDIYVPVMDYFDLYGYPSPSHYQKLRESGKEVWWYVSCMSHGCDALADSGAPDFVIERSPAYIRSIPWIASVYGIDAFLYYSVNNGYQFFPERDPWKSLWDFSGNGDGTLFYPGRTGEHGFKEEKPIASIRLKLWREASFDAEYIRWMDNLSHPPMWWEQSRRSLIQSPRKWNRNYDAYHSLRKRAGEYLDSIQQ